MVRSFPGLRPLHVLKRSGVTAAAGRRGIVIDGVVVAQHDAVVALRRLARDQAEIDILGDLHRIALERIAEPAAAGHFDDDGLGPGNGLLALALEHGARAERQHAGLAVPAAIAAARRIHHAVVIGADRERRVIEGDDLYHLSETAAVASRAPGIDAVFLAPYQERRHRFGDLDGNVANAAGKRR